jgi:hypothetical protein
MVTKHRKRLISLPGSQFRISPNNTGLLTAYIAETYDLSSSNIDNGTILNCVVQEVNITTGEAGAANGDQPTAAGVDRCATAGQALFTWKSLDHVQPSECYVSPGDTGANGTIPFDYFHINSSVRKG